MNTSHNKNRIVERGWKNILMNILNRPSFGSPENEETKSEQKREGVSSVAQNNTRALKKGNLFLISSSENDIEITANQDPLRDFPSSSGEAFLENELGTHKNTDQVISNLDIDKLGKEKYIACMSYNLVYRLVKNLENEELYIDTFKKLLKFKENCKMEIILTEQELESTFSNSFSHNKEFSKKKKSKKKTNGHSSSLKSSSYYQNNDSNGTFLENGSIRDANSTRADNSKYCLTRRKECVHKLLDSCKENEKFNNVFDKLIDIEEYLVSEQTKHQICSF